MLKSLDKTYGILVVTGTLSMDGNFGWNGIIFIVGTGNVQFRYP